MYIQTMIQKNIDFEMIEALVKNRAPTYEEEIRVIDLFKSQCEEILHCKGTQYTLYFKLSMQPCGVVPDFSTITETLLGVGLYIHGFRIDEKDRSIMRIWLRKLG